MIDGVLLTLGSYMVRAADGTYGDVRVQAREVVGRKGTVFTAEDDSGTWIVSSSPRFESVIGLVGAVIALRVAFLSWFGVAWAVGWVGIVAHGFFMQGRALREMRSLLGEPDVEWSFYRPRTAG